MIFATADLNQKAKPYSDQIATATLGLYNKYEGRYENALIPALKADIYEAFSFIADEPLRAELSEFYFSFCEGKTV